MAKAKSGPGSKPKQDGTKKPAPGRDAKGRLLPGFSGNPDGRPSAKRELQKRMSEKCGEHLEESLDVVLEILRSKDEKSEVRLKAAEFIWDRGLGKPRQSVALEDGDGKPTALVVKWVPGYLRGDGGGDGVE